MPSLRFSQQPLSVFLGKEFEPVAHEPDRGGVGFPTRDADHLSAICQVPRARRKEIDRNTSSYRLGSRRTVDLTRDELKTVSKLGQHFAIECLQIGAQIWIIEV